MTKLMNCLTDFVPLHEVSLPCHQNFQKDRWRPTELELATLKLHFDKNPLPSKEDKLAIIRSMQEESGSTIEINHLNRWFQNRRKRTTNQYVKYLIRSRYKRLNEDQLTELNQSFAKNNYPKAEEMADMAHQLHVSYSKIENWYKYNRRSLAKQGCFTIKTKKYFRQTELSYLLEAFQENSHPSRDKIQLIADTLGCHEIQVKNWFSNRRKKNKFLDLRNSSRNTKDKSYDSKSDLSPNTIYQEDNSLLSQALEPMESVCQEESSEVLPVLPTLPDISFPKPMEHTSIEPVFPSESLPVIFPQTFLHAGLPKSAPVFPSQTSFISNVLSYPDNPLKIPRMDWAERTQVNDLFAAFRGHTPNPVCLVNPMNSIVILGSDLQLLNTNNRFCSFLNTNTQINSMPITCLPVKSNPVQYINGQYLHSLKSNFYGGGYPPFVSGLNFNVPL